MPRSTRLTQRQAERHEALMVRLGALLDQLRPLAAKHAEAPVSAVMTDLAKQLLAEAAWFCGPARPVPSPAADGAGLLAQLSELRARLDHFEAQHSIWDPAQNARVWMLRRGRLHIRRLRPVSTTLPRAQSNPESIRLRKLLEHRINAITKGMVEE